MAKRDGFSRQIWTQNIMPALSVVSTSASSQDQLTALKTARRELLAEGTRLAGLEENIRETEEAEDKALQAIDALSRAELATVKDWHASGCVGDMPHPDVAKRNELAKKLAAAQAAMVAAKGDVPDPNQRRTAIAEKQAIISQQLAAIDAEIADSRFAVIEDEVSVYVRELRDLINQTNSKLAKITGLRMCLGDQGRHHQSRGEYELMTQFFRCAEQLSSFKAPALDPDVADIDLARRFWNDRLNALLEE